MSIARQLVRGFRNLLQRKRADEDIADEVDNFFAEAKADFEARGLSAHEAARAAGMALGSNTALREHVRSYGWENWIDGIVQDLRYTLRRLRATPGFTLVSIGTLALGLGASSAIFSVINGVLLKPLPYVHPDELVAVWMTAPGVKITDLNMAPSVYFTMRAEQRAFQGVSMFGTGGTFPAIASSKRVKDVRASDFVRSGLMLSAVGCGCGLAAALALAPLMKSLLFSVSPFDPLTYAAMSASLIITAALASYFPARKATRIDPVEALRAE